MNTATTHEVATISTPVGDKKILLVGDLLELLKKCDPNDQVLLGTHAVGGEWCNVESVELPNDEEGYLGLSLIAANTFDSRQF